MVGGGGGGESDGKEHSYDFDSPLAVLTITFNSAPRCSRLDAGQQVAPTSIRTMLPRARHSALLRQAIVNPLSHSCSASSHRTMRSKRLSSYSRPHILSLRHL